MTHRTLMQRLLDERPATQGRDTWQQLEERLSPRARRPSRLLLAAAASVLIVVAAAVFRSTRQELTPPADLYLFIARGDAEGLELTLGKTP